MSQPRIFRVTVEVAGLDAATALYRELLALTGERHPGGRHYFTSGEVILALLDVSRGGLTPTPGPKSLFLAVDAFHDRAARLNVLAPYHVHGEPAGGVSEAFPHDHEAVAGGHAGQHHAARSRSAQPTASGRVGTHPVRCRCPAGAAGRGWARPCR